MDEKRPGIIRRSFSFLTALISGLRLLLVNLFFIAAIVVVVVIISHSELPQVPDKGALVLDIKGRLVDQLNIVDPLVSLMGGSSSRQQETLLQDVLDAIQYAKDDSRINSMVISLDQLAYGGISKMQEVAVAIDEFRANGKKIVAIGDNYTQDQYWLASQADELYVHPMGGILLQGYGLYRSYYKRALDKLRINFHIFRVGTYKSAMEPFMRDDMSEQAREANLVWLDSLWNDYTGSVAKRRNLKQSDINEYINTLDQLMEKHDGNSAGVAMAAGLVDGVKTRDQMNDYLRELVGATDKNGAFAHIGLEEYLWVKKLESSTKQSDTNIGVIVASGNIIDGEQPPGTIGGDTLASLIRGARTDQTVKALVLRVDSGGGSAFASEIIRRELELFKKEGKPLVVSMGSMAASGGYWISALADEIWATSTTLTGSIGIFGAFPTIENTLGEMGVTTDGVGTTELAGSLRIDRPLQPIAARVIQSSIEHGYDKFLDIVADGRSLGKLEVEKIAEGRVWSGADAKELGLVDSIGGLEQAVKAAATLANLEDYNKKLIEIPLSPQQQLFIELSGRVSVFKGSTVVIQLHQWLAPFRDSLIFVSQMNDPKGQYLFCTACVAP
jgi:protease IV